MCGGLIMPVPILLVTGFLGVGKTTVVNHLLAHAEGRRIAAVVNDFGAINIDAELITGASDGVVSLSNGCICCSLQGDLLRTLAALLRRDPRPEFIVIETSGVADPSDIVRRSRAAARCRPGAASGGGAGRWSAWRGPRDAAVPRGRRRRAGAARAGAATAGG